MENIDRTATRKLVAEMSDEEFGMRIKGRQLSLDEIVKFTGSSASAIHRMIELKKFPKSVEISPNEHAWLFEDVFCWCGLLIETWQEKQHDLVVAALWPHENT